MDFLAHLAYMPMSLCNHDLSIMCCCHHHFCHCCQQCHCHWCCFLCTAVPVTTLLIGIHILHIYVHISLICVHEILGQCNVHFWNDSHFNNIFNVALLSIWLSLEPLYLAQVCIYTGTIYKKNIMHLDIIFLKLWIFKKNYILHFLAHIHAKDANPHPHL